MGDAPGHTHSHIEVNQSELNWLKNVVKKGETAEEVNWTVTASEVEDVEKLSKLVLEVKPSTIESEFCFN